MARTFSEMIILGAVSIVIAFLLNTIMPGGIPLFGEWDPTVGLVHAGGPCAPSLDQVNDIDVMDLYLRSTALFIDARSEDEFSAGHIPRAVNLPLREIDDLISGFLSEWSLETRLVLYCSGPDCHDSHDLAKILKEYGYQFVTVYSHGFDHWKKAGRPVETAESALDE